MPQKQVLNHEVAPVAKEPGQHAEKARARVKSLGWDFEFAVAVYPGGGCKRAKLAPARCRLLPPQPGDDQNRRPELSGSWDRR